MKFAISSEESRPPTSSVPDSGQNSVSVSELSRSLLQSNTLLPGGLEAELETL